jgi:hypothetical protein
VRVTVNLQLKVMGVLRDSLQKAQEIACALLRGKKQRSTEIYAPTLLPYSISKFVMEVKESGVYQGRWANFSTLTLF